MKRRNLFKLGAGALVVPFVGESKQEPTDFVIDSCSGDLRCYSVDPRAFNHLWPTAQVCGCSQRFTRILIERIDEETGRGEMVVANALKSIMMRLSRPATIDQINKITDPLRPKNNNEARWIDPLKIEDSITYKIQVVSVLASNHNSLLDGKDKAKVRELSSGIFQAFTLDAWCKLHNEGKI